MNIGTIAVIGAGQMGSGIAQVAAQAGFKVLLHDVSDSLIARGLENIENGLQRLQRKEKISS